MRKLFLEITESNLEKFITGIELLIMKMPPREYLNLLKEKLKEAIVSCKRKREIEDYSLNIFLFSLIWGIHKIFYIEKHVIFSSRRI